MATYESKKYATIPIAATQVADGSVTDAEYQFINTLSSNAQTQINSKLTAAGAFTIATGMILPWAAPAADKPAGYLLCDGSAVSRSTYSALFALIATTHGAGNGSSTFNVPNFQNRMAIGKSGTYSLGSTGGSTTESYTPAGSVAVSGTTDGHALTQAQLPNITLTPQQKAKTEDKGTLNRGSSSGSGASYEFLDIPLGGSGATHSHGFSGTGSLTGTGATLDILNPYISINFIIKT